MSIGYPGDEKVLCINYSRRTEAASSARQLAGGSAGSELDAAAILGRR